MEKVGQQAEGAGWEQVPVVEISGLYSKDEAKRREVAALIGRACREVGFFYVSNHNVPHPLIDEVYTAMKQFFGQSLDEKRKIAMTNCPEGHRGYFGLLEENTDVKNSGDVKEGVDFGHDFDHDPSKPIEPLRGINQWPDDSKLPGWRETVKKYFDAVNALGKDLLRGLALDLGLDELYFHHMFEPGLMILRFLHYPPQDPKHASFDDKQIGCGAHTDYGCMTILYQDLPGLQVQNVDGKWVEAPPLPGTFVVNLGDMMEQWTNGLYKATMHRVLNVSGDERYSIPFFFEPNYDTIVSPLHTCVTEERPAAFKPVVYGEHLTYKLDITYPHRQVPKDTTTPTAQ